MHFQLQNPRIVILRQFWNFKANYIIIFHLVNDSVTLNHF